MIIAKFIDDKNKNDTFTLDELVLADHSMIVSCVSFSFCVRCVNGHHLHVHDYVFVSFSIGNEKKRCMDTT